MNTNKIMNNWKNYTNTNTVQEWNDIHNADPYSSYDTDMMIAEFCEYYNYNTDVEIFLDNSFTL